MSERETGEGKLLYPDLSYEVIGCAMEVHRELGPGQVEAFYHQALRKDLEARGFSCESKLRGRLIHRGMRADSFEADLLVEDKLFLELKAMLGGFIADNYTQLICYLHFWNKALGLLLNFGQESLVQERVPYTRRPVDVHGHGIDSYFSGLATQNRNLAARLVDAITRINEKYGTAYRDTTYLGLLRAELLAEDIPCELNPLAPLHYANMNLGMGQLPCLLVDQRCMLRVHALYDHLPTTHHAVARAYTRHLEVPFGLIVNFGRTACDIFPVRDTTTT